MGLISCTISSVSILETAGDDDITSQVLVITPDVGYTLDANDGSFNQGVLPGGIASILFTNTTTGGEEDNLVHATVDIDDAYIMPAANTTLTLDISGTAVLIPDTIDIQVALVHPFEDAPQANISYAAANGVLNTTTSTSPVVTYFNGTIPTDVSTHIATVTLIPNTPIYTPALGGQVLTTFPEIYPLTGDWVESFEKFDWLLQPELTVTNGDFMVSLTYHLMFKDDISHTTPLAAGDVINGRSTHLNVVANHIPAEAGLTVDTVDFGSSTSGLTIPVEGVFPDEDALASGVFPVDDTISVFINGSTGSEFTLDFDDGAGGDLVPGGLVNGDGNVIDGAGVGVPIIMDGGKTHLHYGFAFENTDVTKTFSLRLTAGTNTTINPKITNVTYSQYTSPVVRVDGDIPATWTDVTAVVGGVEGVGLPGRYGEDLDHKADSMHDRDFTLEWVGVNGTFKVDVANPTSVNITDIGDTTADFRLRNLVATISGDNKRAYISGNSRLDRFGLTNTTKQLILDSIFTYTILP